MLSLDKSLKLKKIYLVIIFVIFELLIATLYMFIATAAAMNRGSDIANIGITICGIGLLINIVPLILVIASKITTKTGLYALLLSTTLTCALSVFGSSWIYHLQSAMTLSSYENIRQNTKVTVLSDNPILKDGLPVGIRVELEIALPEKHIFTSRLRVPGHTDEHKRYNSLMRMLACGTIEPSARCYFLTHTSAGGLTQTDKALDEKDYVRPFWPNNVDKRKIRRIYFELVPASGQSARDMKSYGTYQVSTELLSGQSMRLPLRLWLNSRVKDYELATFDVQTRNTYNLRDMFINSGRDKVLSEILTP
jgi:hypothetical protein